jgi:hypothetical protein
MELLLVHAMVVPPPPPPLPPPSISVNMKNTFCGLTDRNGNIFYQMTISKYARSGQYIINVQTIAPNDTRDNTPLEISIQKFYSGDL